MYVSAKGPIRVGHDFPHAVDVWGLHQGLDGARGIVAQFWAPTHYRGERLDLRTRDTGWVAMVSYRDEDGLPEDWAGSTLLWTWPPPAGDAPTLGQGASPGKSDP